MQNGMFARMCREAADKLASGDKGWKEVDTNTLLMACFHLLTNHLTHSITKPLWWAAGCVGSAAVIYVGKTFIDWVTGG